MADSSLQVRAHDSDDDLDDILKDVTNPEDPIQSTENPTQPQYRKNNKSDNAGALGVDEEIVITKKRIPIPKLDDQRLLSDPGIPRLRKISKERLRFKGKGHEVWLFRTSERYQANSVAVWRHCSHAEHVSTVARRPLPPR
jgi:replication fork protection complex subunit Csm3/Swi3